MKTCILSIALTLCLQGQLTSRACGSYSGREKFVAHEWGTFTSVQGADGIQLEWNPFVKEELPKFVYDRNQTQNNLFFPAKNAFVARQRMETPVIYFYSDRERTVDVTVKFPEGLVTEWYPQIATAKPLPLFWKDVRIMPQRPHPSLDCSSPGPQDPLPKETSGSHYYAARETDANVVQVKSGQKAEHEKFLFYRGVGNFTVPLKVTSGPDASYLQLVNSDAEPMRHLYLLHVHKGTAKYHYIDQLAAGENRFVKLQLTEGRMPLSDAQVEISAAMKSSLEREGLYPAEAAAMVKTWRDSWFGEDGLRVLYVLSRTWTDRTLPLTIQPSPDEITRVMVGRAEVIAPDLEWKILKQIVRYSEADEAAKAKAVADTRILGIGRFLDAIVRKSLGKAPSAEFSQAAWGLWERANAQERPGSLAQR